MRGGRAGRHAVLLLVGLGRGGVDLLGRAFFVLVGDILFEALFEPADALAHRTAELRDAGRAKDEDDDREDEKELWCSDIGHAYLSFSCSRLRDRSPGR